MGGNMRIVITENVQRNRDINRQQAEYNANHSLLGKDSLTNLYSVKKIKRLEDRLKEIKFFN